MRQSFSVILVCFFSVICGCATAPRTVGGAAIGFSSGIEKDTKDTVNSIIKADQWIEENFW